MSRRRLLMSTTSPIPIWATVPVPPYHAAMAGIYR